MKHACLVLIHLRMANDTDVLVPSVRRSRHIRNILLLNTLLLNEAIDDIDIVGLGLVLGLALDLVLELVLELVLDIDLVLGLCAGCRRPGLGFGFRLALGFGFGLGLAFDLAATKGTTAVMSAPAVGSLFSEVSSSIGTGNSTGSGALATSASA